jgi:nucleoside-diphosphate-sugar epimerase
MPHNDPRNILKVLDVKMEGPGRLINKVEKKGHSFRDVLKGPPDKHKDIKSNAKKLKTILVTGGAGYVGSILVRQLLQDYKVVCIDNLKFGGASLIDIWDHPNLLFRKIDITDYPEVDQIIDSDSETYFAIIHLAAIVGDPACKLEPELARKTNLDASIHLLKKAVQSNIERFVFASTCSNYGKMGDPDGYVEETSPLAPVSLYAELKVEFESLLLNTAEKGDNFSPTCLRFATVYGISPRMRFDLTVNEFTKELALGKELTVFGEQFWRPYCHVRDFSRAIMTVLEAPKDKVQCECFNVGSTEENYTKKMIVEELLKLFPKARIRRIEKKEDPRNYRVKFEKINQKLDFAISKTVPEGIKEIKEAIELGIINNPEDQKYYNIPHINS